MIKTVLLIQFSIILSVPNQDPILKGTVSGFILILICWGISTILGQDLKGTVPVPTVLSNNCQQRFSGKVRCGAINRTVFLNCLVFLFNFNGTAS